MSQKKSKRSPRRTGLYVKNIPVDEIRTVAGQLGIPPEAVIGLLLRPFKGKVAETVREVVATQLQLFTEESNAESESSE